MKGNITISRPIFGCGKEAIEISISDESSRTRIITFSMSYDEFALAITGLSQSKGEINRLVGLTGFERIGKKKESKKEYCAGYDYGSDKKELADFIESHSIDGWTLWDDGESSQQNYSEGHKVIFARWV